MQTKEDTMKKWIKIHKIFPSISFKLSFNLAYFSSQFPLVFSLEFPTAFIFQPMNFKFFVILNAFNLNAISNF